MQWRIKNASPADFRVVAHAVDLGRFPEVVRAGVAASATPAPKAGSDAARLFEVLRDLVEAGEFDTAEALAAVLGEALGTGRRGWKSGLGGLGFPDPFESNRPPRRGFPMPDWDRLASGRDESPSPFSQWSLVSNGFLDWLFGPAPSGAGVSGDSGAHGGSDAGVGRRDMDAGRSSGPSDMGAGADAGTDARRNGGTDAGHDGGTDAGHDGGTDAGHDGGTSAGGDGGTKSEHREVTVIDDDHILVQTEGAVWVERADGHPITHDEYWAAMDLWAQEHGDRQTAAERRDGDGRDVDPENAGPVFLGRQIWEASPFARGHAQFEPRLGPGRGVGPGPDYRNDGPPAPEVRVQVGGLADEPSRWRDPNFLESAIRILRSTPNPGPRPGNA